MSELYVAAGAYVRELRARLDLTQRELAEKADVWLNKLSMLEHGRRVGDVNLAKIAQALGYQDISSFWRDALNWYADPTPGYMQASPWRCAPASPRRLAA